MDNLVLNSVAAEMASRLDGAYLESLRQESGVRFRFNFGPRISSSVIASLHPETPWIGDARLRWEGPRWSPDPEFAALAGSLRGARLAAVRKEAADRALSWLWSDGRALVINLRPHRASLTLLEPSGSVEVSVPVSRRALESARQAEGRVDPFSATAEEIDAALRAKDALGSADDLRHALIGVSRAAAALALAEARSSGTTVGTVLFRRLRGVATEATEVVIEGPHDPRAAVEDGSFSAGRYTLWPWRPAQPTGGNTLFSEGSAMATAGLYHDAAEEAGRVRARLVSLTRLLARERARATAAEARVRDDASSLGDPERYQRLGEALLAGMHGARRSGDEVFVADPYDAESRVIAIPAPAGRPLPVVADDLFRRARRSRRGREAAAARAVRLASHGAQLDLLIRSAEGAATRADAERLEDGMRTAGMAIGLGGRTKARRVAARQAPPRIEGIRMIRAPGGETILVGRTGPDNDRLTFKIAGPDDLWLHAAGVPGAHVVIQLSRGELAPPRETLSRAAELAAWFSDARSAGAVDVHWTRRKHVRRARGGASGQVTLKRFETLRVRPAPPSDSDPSG